jgi:hypothetical protein
VSPRPRELLTRLLDASSRYENAEIAAGTAYIPMVVAALVARSRHMARVIVRLADEGETTEAQVLLRALLEYAVTINWLDLDREKNPRHWLISDIRRRLAADNELRQLGEPPIIADANRQRYEGVVARFEQDLGGNPGQLPSVQQQAQQIEFPIGYSLAYRFDSQSGVHPTSLGAEQMLEAVEDGFRLRTEPPPGSAPDPYAVAATLLLLALDGGRELVPFIQLDDDYAQVKAEVEGLAPMPPPPQDALLGLD